MDSPSTGVDIARVHTHVYDDDGDGPGRGWIKELQVGTTGDPDQDHFAAYSHDEHTGRLNTVTHKGTESFAYDYLAKSHLVETITGPNLGADAFTVTNTYEAYRDLRVRVRSAKAATGLIDYQYQYNQIGQRYNYIEDGSLVGNNGGSDGSWIIGYNDKGEVVRVDRSHKEFFDQTTGIPDAPKRNSLCHRRGCHLSKPIMRRLGVIAIGTFGLPAISRLAPQGNDTTPPPCPPARSS